MKSNPTWVMSFYTNREKYQVLRDCWSDPHRKFHDIHHLNSILAGLDLIKDSVTDQEWDALCLAAWYHDAYYVPGDIENEEKSVNIMKDLCDYNEKSSVVAVLKMVEEIILSTKKIQPKTGIFDIFQKLDCSVLIKSNFEQLLKYESQIYQEFQRFPWQTYKNTRVDFLLKMSEFFTENKENLKKLAEYVASKRPRIGIYAGSFSPFHIGHLEVLRQSEQVFDKVVIAFGKNPEKEDREVICPKTISNRETVVYNGFLSNVLMDYQRQGCDVTLIRGLRNEYDLNYEQNLVQYIKDQIPVKVVFFLCDKQYEHISSGAIRALNKIDKNSTFNYLVP